MAKPLLILIGGAPATGKTTLGRRIADEFSLPFIAKDAIKERLFDTLGWSDRAWSRRLGVAAFELLYDLADVELRAGKSCIAEANFRHNDTLPRLVDFQSRYDFSLLQITCVCDPEIVVARFRARWEAGLRHPGHVQEESVIEELREQMAQDAFAPLNLDSTILSFDTSNLATIDYTPIFAAIQQAMQ